MKKREYSAEDTPTRATPWQGLQLTLVQSTVCVLALLTVLLLKWIGGDAYTVLAAQFERAMTEDTLVSAMTPRETVSAEDAVQEEVKEVVGAVSLQTEVENAVCAPLTGGVLTSPFGAREDPFDASQQDTHYGVDIGADEGTVLYAFRDGVVTEVGYEEDGYGHYLIVSCDEEHSYVYAHCSRVDVTTGQAITAGEAVALVGNTGRSTGSHLHFEWREKGQAVDPTDVLPRETYV